MPTRVVGHTAYLTLRIPSFAVHFRVQRFTRFSKIFEAYCSKKRVARDHVRFLFDGQRINPDSTLHELAMESGDSVDCSAFRCASRGRELKSLRSLSNSRLLS